MPLAMRRDSHSDGGVSEAGIGTGLGVAPSVTDVARVEPGCDYFAAAHASKHAAAVVERAYSGNDDLRRRAK